MRTHRMAVGRSGLWIGACAAALLTAYTGPSFAQEVQVSEVVIVTASRREQAQIEAPVAVTAVNVNQAISQGVTDINGLADFVPGLNATDGGAPGLGNLVVRGLYAGSGAPTTGIYVDDVPYGPVVGGAGQSLALDGTLFDLNRVEVVRGPQGTLFGSSAMGGVVRYVTQQPSLTKTEGFLFADASNTEDGGWNTLLRGRVSVPLARDRVAVSLSGFRSETEGYTDHPGRRLTGVDDSEFWGGMFSVRAEITPDFSVRLTAAHQAAEYDAVAAEAFNPTTGRRLLGPRQDVPTQPTPRSLEFTIYALTADYDFGWATLSSATSHQTVNFANQIDLTATFGPLADALAPRGAPHRVGFESAFDTDRFTQEFRLTSRGSEKFEWLLGAYYTDQSTSDTQVLTPSPDDILLLNANLPTNYTETAVFGNGTFYITPKWDVTVGARYADIETELNSTLRGSPFLIGPGPFPSGSVNSQTVDTYLINTRYRFSDDLNFYARAANGYRPGGPNLVITVGTTTIGQPRYQSDTLWSYEAGFKGRLLGGGLTYDVGAFVMDWDDAQLVSSVGGLSATVNARGGVQVRGIEASVAGKLFENFTVNASFNLNDSEFQSNEPALGALAGEGLANAPDVKFALSGDYRFKVLETAQASVGATLRYNGEYNTSYRGGGTIAPPVPNYVNDGYSQIDVRAGLDIGRTTWTLYVTNLTNEDAYQTIFTTSAAYAQGIILRPRTIGLNARLNF